MNKSDLAMEIFKKTRKDEEKEGKGTGSGGPKGTGSGGPKISLIDSFINAFIETVAEELKRKGKITLVGFGTFTVVHRKKKTGINPKTGDKITIASKNVPVFKPGKALKEMVK